MVNNQNLKILPDVLKVKGEDTRKRYYVPPVKVIKTWGNVKDADTITERTIIQATLAPVGKPCVLKNMPGTPHAAMLVDYGCEIHGSVRIAVWNTHKDGKGQNIPFKARVRFGESIAEAMSDIGGENNATNDHAIRDGIMDIAFMSAQDTTETGFRYLYFEVLDDDIEINFGGLTGVLIVNDMPYLGSFETNDERLNKIWHTAAYTVFLSMQEYLWDGIKRDRVVWLGDMNTEVEAALSIFGDTAPVRRSLQYGVDTTPLPQWMNGIPSYSFWWLINLYKVYMYSGDVALVEKYHDYIVGLVRQVLSYITDDGQWTLTGIKRPTFIDWSTESDNNAQVIGFKGLLGVFLDRACEVLEVLGERGVVADCKAKKAALVANAPAAIEQKIASALLAIGGLADAAATDRDFIEPGGVSGYSTFMGYSILNAKAAAGNIGGGIQACRDYWGAMLDMGATTFWEDFDIEWAKGSTRIDEFPVEGKKSVHGDFGRHCYIKLRLSLCHGWSAGPCPWLIENVLGVHVVKAGMSEIAIKPYLGDLETVKGSVPTPFGVVEISHRKGADGKVYTKVTSPAQVKITFIDCISE